MNSRTQNTIGKIFMQYTIALAVFASLGIIDQANAETITTQKNNLIQEALFESQAVTNTKAYLASKTEQFTELENQLAEQADATSYNLGDATTHLYAKNIRLDSNDAEKSWPLFSLNVQEGNLNVKMGSRYQR